MNSIGFIIINNWLLTFRPIQQLTFSNYENSYKNKCSNITLSSSWASYAKHSQNVIVSVNAPYGTFRLMGNENFAPLSLFVQIKCDVKFIKIRGKWSHSGRSIAQRNWVRYPLRLLEVGIYIIWGVSITSCESRSRVIVGGKWIEFGHIVSHIQKITTYWISRWAPAIESGRATVTSNHDYKHVKRSCEYFMAPAASFGIYVQGAVSC